MCITHNDLEGVADSQKVVEVEKMALRLVGVQVHRRRKVGRISSELEMSVALEGPELQQVVNGIAIREN
jgi:hypothetical protein